MEVELSRWLTVPVIVIVKQDVPRDHSHHLSYINYIIISDIALNFYIHLN